MEGKGCEEHGGEGNGAGGVAEGGEGGLCDGVRDAAHLFSAFKEGALGTPRVAEDRGGLEMGDPLGAYVGQPQGGGRGLWEAVAYTSLLRECHPGDGRGGRARAPLHTVRVRHGAGM